MRKLLLAVVLIALLAVVVLAAWRVGPVPTIAIEPKAQVIGQRTLITIRVSEPKRGLANIKAELVQGESARTLAEKQHTPAPAWAPWQHGTTSEALAVQAGKDAIPDLKPGSAIVRVTAQRAGMLGWTPSPAVSQIELPVRLVPPTLQVMSKFTYVARGGAEAVVYRVGDTSTRDGVRVGTYFFPGFALPNGSTGERFAFFAVPSEMEDASKVELVAEDGAGNVATRKFVDQFFPKPLRHDTIHLSDAFMQKVTSEIMAQTPALADKGNLLDNYLQINRDLRKTDDAFLRELAKKSEHAFAWREPFQPMVNTAIKANFAERRTYEYQGKTVDEQNHLGLDMASLRADPVPASNDGTIAFAAYLGIYGNCVVIDHGYGLQTLYGHLSSIDVKEGQKVKRGEIIGKSGSTGLAGGDHLHFAVLLAGVPVTPIEWFDSKWINDRLKLKLGAALPYEKPTKDVASPRHVRHAKHPRGR